MLYRTVRSGSLVRHSSTVITAIKGAVMAIIIQK